MKFFVIVSVFTLVFCVRESESFKILKKLKEYLHPTSTESLWSTISIPTIPGYEKQHGQRENDWSSEEQESSKTIIKSKPGEDSSTSQSSENHVGSFTNPKKSYNSDKPDKTKSYPEDSIRPNMHTTETNTYNSEYGSNKEVYPSNNQENYPGESQSAHGSETEKVKSTTLSYELSSQNQPDQVGIYNQNTQSTTENNFDVPYNTPEQLPHSSSFGSVSIDDVLSSSPKNIQVSGDQNDIVGQSTTTENFVGSVNQNHDDQSSGFSNPNVKDLQSTSSSPDDASYNNYNTPEQPSSFENISDNVNPTTSTETYSGSQTQNYDGQSLFSNPNVKDLQSTSSRPDDASYNNYNTPEQPSSFGSTFDNVISSTSTETYSGSENQNYYGQPSVNSNVNYEKTQSTPRTDDGYNSFDRPDQSPSYSYLGSVVSSTRTYDITNLNDIEPGLTSGNGYNQTRPGILISTTPSSSHGLSESPEQGGNQQGQTPWSQPSLSSSGRQNQTEHEGYDRGIIIFPDDPRLNPTPENERVFGENDPYFQRIKGHNKSTPVPAPDCVLRGLFGAPPKKCGPGQTYDSRRQTCKALSRK